MMMMMTLTQNPLDHRFLELCCCSVATGLAIDSLAYMGSLLLQNEIWQFRNSACFKTETKPLMSRQQQTAPTIRSPFGGTSKSPVLDDGGGIGGGGEGGWKFEFYRGGDGQGPGGGGGDWSGEFYFILFILFLVLLRDRKKEKRMQEEEEEDRRM
ncbi:hypothetical protein AG4045_018213 [Apium graveolens]|uniref:Uncharacterized protein n=1 Tax=Apium graveolens TaxID=4045 RepID=A0A6L5BAW7_APIGR|nr:hypothetical protein AG4045_018213 [Apium graveolens]